MNKLDSIYDIGCSICAFIGKQKGYITFSECITDSNIYTIVEEALKEALEAYKIEDKTDQIKNDVQNKISNVKDSIDKFYSHSEQILSSSEGLVNAALISKKNGLLPYYLTKGISYAFLVTNDTPADFKKYISKYGIKKSIIKYCQLNKEVELVQLILDHYRKALTGEMQEDTKKVDLLKKAYSLGFQFERDYKGCGQCTLGALFKVTETIDKMLFQSATGLSGGMGLCGDGSCGGYTGGILFMGTYVGRRLDYIESDIEAKNKAYEMAQKLHDKLIEVYGSVVCEDIHKSIFGQSFIIRNDEVKDGFEEAGAHKDKCTTVVASICMWVTEILLEENFIKI